MMRIGIAPMGILLVVVLSVSFCTSVAQDTTYAERLGWGPDDRVLILHADDVGMHRDVNVGTIKALEEGVLTSVSTMMPCSWVPEWNNYLKENPHVCNGLHLTLTSEWNVYRWTPLAGIDQVPGLVDAEGYMHRGVMGVVMNSNGDEVEKEIRAQIALAEHMGMPITHLDTHMGTLAATREFFERLVKVGIEKQIPILAVGGHGTQARQQWPQSIPVTEPFMPQVWEGGLPVIDDLDMRSYGWHNWEEKKEGMIQSIRDLKPGITEIIVHCAWMSDTLPHVLRNTDVRINDTKILIDPDFKKAIEEEGIILTNWRELMERRQRVAKE
jgi:chitin disaccharide deacetylase